MIAYQLNFGLKSKNIMLIKHVAYLLIAFQIPLVLCGPQGLNFNGSNPYYDSYLQNWGNNDNLNSHSTTQKSLYPTLYPQIPNTTPQPHYAKGQQYPIPNSNYFNRNSSFQNPSNNYGPNNFNNSVGWNTNFNPYTTPSSTYQPYGQYSTTTAKPPVTTFSPYSPTGSFNRYNQTNSYPAFNRTNPTYPSYHHNNINRTNPNYPPYQPQSTLPPYTPWANNFSNYHPQPNFPSSYPVSNKTNPTYPSYNNNNINRTNPMYPPYQPQSTPSPNSFTNYRPSYPTSPSYPVSNRTTPTYPTYPTYNNYNNNNRTNPTKTNNFHNTSSFNHNSNRYDNQYNPQNSNRYDNQYNPQYQPSAPALMPSKPTFDQNGTPLATFSTYHSNQPIDDYLFNYDNLHHRRPINDMQSGQFRQSNDVPLAPFPGEKPPTYNSNSQVPLAPFPG